jgi:hypothetical protein
MALLHLPKHPCLAGASRSPEPERGNSSAAARIYELPNGEKMTTPFPSTLLRRLSTTTDPQRIHRCRVVFIDLEFHIVSRRRTF